MTKEHAYAYEAGYRDGSVNYELEHCPACKNVADLQEALDENAKLREDIRDLEVCYQLLSDRLGQDFSLAVQTDVMNAKLQKLVDYMTPIAWYAASESERNRMRELGIEVD